MTTRYIARRGTGKIVQGAFAGSPTDLAKTTGCRLGAYRVWGNGDGTVTIVFNLWQGPEQIGLVWYTAA